MTGAGPSAATASSRAVRTSLPPSPARRQKYGLHMRAQCLPPQLLRRQLPSSVAVARTRAPAYQAANRVAPPVDQRPHCRRSTREQRGRDLSSAREAAAPPGTAQVSRRVSPLCGKRGRRCNGQRSSIAVWCSRQPTAEMPAKSRSPRWRMAPSWW